MTTDFSRADPVVKVMIGTPLIEMLEQFSKGLHRAALCNDDQSVETVVTQSNSLRWLVPRLTSFGTLFEVKLRDLGNLGFGDVLSVRCDPIGE